MSKIYAIIAFAGDSAKHPWTLDKSTVMGLFLNEEGARRAVLENRGNLNEAGFYENIVIEEYFEGIQVYSRLIQWYEWQNHKWVEIKDPRKEEDRNIIGYIT